MLRGDGRDVRGQLSRVLLGAGIAIGLLSLLTTWVERGNTYDVEVLLPSLLERTPALGLTTDGGAIYLLATWALIFVSLTGLNASGRRAWLLTAIAAMVMAASAAYEALRLTYPAASSYETPTFTSPSGPGVPLALIGAALIGAAAVVLALAVRARPDGQHSSPEQPEVPFRRRVAVATMAVGLAMLVVGVNDALLRRPDWLLLLGAAVPLILIGVSIIELILMYIRSPTDEALAPARISSRSARFATASAALSALGVLELLGGGNNLAWPRRLALLAMIMAVATGFLALVRAKSPAQSWAAGGALSVAMLPILAVAVLLYGAAVAGGMGTTPTTPNYNLGSSPAPYYFGGFPQCLSPGLACPTPSP